MPSIEMDQLIERNYKMAKQKGLSDNTWVIVSICGVAVVALVILAVVMSMFGFDVGSIV